MRTILITYSPTRSNTSKEIDPNSIRRILLVAPSSILRGSSKRDMIMISDILESSWVISVQFAMWRGIAETTDPVVLLSGLMREVNPLFFGDAASAEKNSSR